MVYVVLLAGTGLMFNAVPRGFIPNQDKLYLIAGVKLPEGSSLERTDCRVAKDEGPSRSGRTVSPRDRLTGFNPTQQTNTPNMPLPFRS